MPAAPRCVPILSLVLLVALGHGTGAFAFRPPPAPTLARRGGSLRGLRAPLASLRMEGGGGSGFPDDEETNPFAFLNKNILFPANYQPDMVSKDHDKVNEEGDREVISVPVNGESVPIAQIRPKMAMVYTCKVCETRQMKQFSKLAYEKGIVIIQCKGCPKKHLIADNLGWYKDWLGKGNTNIEEMLGDRGETTRRVQGRDAAMIYGEWAEETEMADPMP